MAPLKLGEMPSNYGNFDGVALQIAKSQVFTDLSKVSRMILVILIFWVPCWVPKLDSACLTLSRKNQPIGLQIGKSKECCAKVGFYLLGIERKNQTDLHIQ